MTIVHSVALVPGVVLNAAADGPERAAELASWLRNAPVAAGAVRSLDAIAWGRENGRPFDAVRECLLAISEAHRIADDARQRQGELRAASGYALRRRDNDEFRRLAGLAHEHRVEARAAEAVGMRLARHLEALMRGAYAARHRPGQAPEPDWRESRSLHADGAFVRRTRAQQLQEAQDAAADILGVIPGPSPEVCQAYSILDAARWADPAPPPDEVETLREQVSWLCELVDMAYRCGFEISDPDGKTFTEIPGRKLPRPVSAAEIRAAISRRPPPLLDERSALDVGAAPEDPSPPPRAR